jgi:hypothetical protein
VSVHVVPVPKLEHAPPHPEKVNPDFGLSVKVTLVPLAMGCEQLAPEQATVPLPVPAIVIDIVKVVGDSGVNVTFNGVPGAETVNPCCTYCA